jgi:hypothetical protein
MISSVRRHCETASDKTASSSVCNTIKGSMACSECKEGLANNGKDCLRKCCFWKVWGCRDQRARFGCDGDRACLHWDHKEYLECKRPREEESRISIAEYLGDAVVNRIGFGAS